MTSSRKNKNGEYFLGLDIGTDSVGWCVTDPNYRVLKFTGKATWGVRLFDSANPAAERRGFRCSRRRLQRRRQRVRLVEELLNREVCKIDPEFFMRLRESRFLLEDKNEEVRSRFSLFADKTYTDWDYHHEFPTIYHLRQALMAHRKKYDIRLYYLAIIHFMKHRGHFLLEGNVSDARDFNEVYSEFQRYAREEMELEFEPASVEAVQTLLTDKRIGKTDKKKQMNALFHVTKDDAQKGEALAALCGSKVNLNKLFNDEELKDAQISSFSFADGVEDDKIEQLSATLGDRFEFFLKLKAIYDWTVLEEILGDKDSITDAQVARYDKHRVDLRTLKSLFRRYLPNKYAEFFSGSGKSGGYSSYVGHASGKNVVLGKKTERHDFCDEVKKLLKGVSAKDATLERVMRELDEYTFMPKQVSKANSSVPYQLHLQDLEKIVEALGKDYPALATKDSDGLSVCEKILSIFKFRIPYYVGPLNTSHSKKGGNSWMVRNSEVETAPIRPWNFKKQVDLGASAKAFMDRLTNKCTRLFGEDVLPKDSLLYSRYMVLNELNNVRIDGQRLSAPLKQKIYTEVFQRRTGKLTLTKLGEWLKKEGLVGEDAQLSGIDGTFQATLKSYQDFARIIGDKVNTEPYMVDKIIREILIFGEERKMLRERIRGEFHDKLTDEQIARISKLSYSGWGRFSRKFLNGIVDAKSAGGQTVIQAMWEGQENLMELLSAEHGFTAAINEFNGKTTGVSSKLSYALVRDTYASPAVKRGVWQTLRIIEELRGIMGGDPARIFLEVAREKEKNPTRKESRKKQLLDLYKSIKGEERDWIAEIDKRDVREFNGKKLYLYYVQMGRDMYTGEPISLSELFDKKSGVDVYDVDHIIPQSKKKDDSLRDNLVLTRSENNRDKGDVYPIPARFRTPERKTWWKSLVDKGLITKEKYERLTRPAELSEEELASFINRQLVETRQSTKVVADILKSAFPNSKIVYSKANLVSDFRKDNNFYKSRSVNDYHHAKDAYLNIVVGNVYYTKFTDNPLQYLRGNEGVKYNLNRLFDFDVARGGKIAWVKGDDGTIATVRRQMEKNNVLFTRYATEKRGGFWDQNPLKKKGTLVPLKTGLNPAKYGGFDNPGINYFMLVESDEKKGRKRTLEGLPVYLSGASAEKQLTFLQSETGPNLKNPKILIPKIRINSLLKVDGVPMHISGKTGDRVAMKYGVQLVVEPEYERVIQRIDKMLEQKKESGQTAPISYDPHDKISDEDLTNLYETLEEKAQNPIFRKRLDAQKQKIVDGKAKFEGLGFEEKCRLLCELLKLFQCKFGTADLSSINGSKQAGAFTVSKNLSTNQSVRLIHQSATGLFESEVDLLKVGQ